MSKYVLWVVLSFFANSLWAESGFYIQEAGSDGIVSIEAEIYRAKYAREDHYWDFTTEKAGFSGKGSMVSLPDDGESEGIDYDDSPYVDYKVYFVRTGRHYIWMRGWGVRDGNSADIDLDRRELGGGEEIEFEINQWNWAFHNENEEHAYLDIDTPGVHTISLFMHEDGVIVDKVILATNPDYEPRGVGPAASTDGAVMSFASAKMNGLETVEEEVSIPVELVRASTGRYSVDYAVVGGTADTKDYTLESGTLEFKSGEDLKTIMLSVVQDGLDEDNETVIIKLSNAKGESAQVGFYNMFTYTIVDARPVVEFATKSSGVAERGGFVTVPLRLTAAYDKPVTVSYIASGGTASADDYALTGHSVTFKPGQLESGINVEIKADELDEPSETIKLKLTEAENAILAGESGHTIIICIRSYAQLGGAYYFRYPSGERWEKFAKVGPYTDVMVRMGKGDDRLVFWRGSSYLPFLDIASGKSFVEVVVPQNGDGEGLNFDKMCKHSHIRIVERSDARVIVQWRYIPDFDKSELQWWTEEYFTVYPDGVCYRKILEGTETLEAYQDPSHPVVQQFLLTDQGICPMPESWVKPIALAIDRSALAKFDDLGFDRTTGHYALAAKTSGASAPIRFTIAADVSNPALFVKGWGDAGVRMRVDGKAFDGFKVGYAREIDNNNLVLWLGRDFIAGSHVVIEPVGGSTPVVRAPIRNPYLSKIPLLPESSPHSGPFGAFYRTLNYWEEWDNPWRIGEYADVVVQFDDTIDRLVFWRGTTNVPHWVNERNIWYENEFVERRGGDSGLSGLAEPMQDHESRFSNVRIIQSTPARVLVHWRYAPTTLAHNIPFIDETGWGDWVDEYYYVYPDETCVRDAKLYTSVPNRFNEWQEVIPLVNPGTIPEDVLEMKTLAMANAQGRSRLYDFTNGFPPNDAFEDGLNIVLVRVKGKSKPFAICESAGQWFDPISRPDETRFNHYDDWPAWPEKYRRSDWDRHPEHNYREFWRFLPSHSSLMHLDWDNYESDLDGPIIFLRKILLNGMTQTDDVTSLIPLTKFWENAPLMKVSGYGFSGAVFEKSQKAYILNRRISWIEELVNRDDDKMINKDADKVDLDVFASKDSPVLNPCIIIHSWPKGIKAKLFIDGKEIPDGKDFRQGTETNWGEWEPTSALVLWVRCHYEETVTFTIEMVK